MNKRIIIIGLIVLVIAFLIGSFVLPGVLLGATKFSSQSLVLLPHQSSYVSFFLNDTGFIVMGYQSTSRINFYFANSSAFNILNKYTNDSLIFGLTAQQLYGNGVLEGIPNYTIGMFPYSEFNLGNQTPKNAYVSNAVSLIPNGTYYALFQNIGNSSANINITSDVSSNLKSQGAQVFEVSIVVFIVFISAIGIIIYGIIKKPPAAQEGKLDQSQIDSLYKDVDKKEKGKGKAKK